MASDRTTTLFQDLASLQASRSEWSHGRDRVPVGQDKIIAGRGPRELDA